MPPKKVQDDKTFGMKNKNKSARVQRQVETIQKQQASVGKNKEALAKEKANEEKAKAKEQALAKKRMEAELFKTNQPVQKIPFGTDPKTVLCVYFKNGHCDKGHKCKFSHDVNVGRKTEKVNLYSDAREDKKQDVMENWDEEKLRDVVNQQGQKQSSTTTTDIVCKYFIQAVEDKKYGWFWECPNGGDKCMYRHRLPPGFVLKSDKKKQEEDAKKEKISLEEFLEVERHKLKAPLTPVTLESFAIWKKTRLDKKAAEQEALEKAKNAQRAAGKLTGLSGRALFEVGGDIYDDDDEEGDNDWDITKLLASYRDEDRVREEEEEGTRNGDESGDEADQVADGVGDLKVNGS